MTEQSIKLNAWELNYESHIAVQGEVNSRTLSVTIIDKVGTESYISNAESVDRPIDLTNVTARLYVIKPDGTKTFSDGTVTDARNGKVEFVLPAQAVAVAGKASCQILLTKPDNSALKITGLTLEIQPSNLEGAVESSDEFSALVLALNAVQETVDTANQAAQNAQAALVNANAAISSANAAASAANVAAVSANTAANAANQAAQNTERLYQMVNPLTGQIDYVTNIINDLIAYIFDRSITAQEFDDLNKTAQEIDDMNITARDWDTIAKSLFGLEA